jgi:hypothetical protein
MSNRGKSEINLLRYLRVSYRANLFNQSTRRDRRGVGTSGTCNLSDHGTPSVDSTFSAGRELIANGINGIVLGFCFFEPECKHELVFKAGRFPFDSSNLVDSILRLHFTWIFSWNMSHFCAISVSSRRYKPNGKHRQFSLVCRSALHINFQGHSS